MSQAVMQTAFHVGEWAPALNARVDLQKYHSAAALLRNFFVDYRGGVSSRTGTRYILQCLGSGAPVRLIPFQASFTISYVLEFGNGYIRFYNNGAPVLETAIAITNAVQTNPAVVQLVNPWAVNDWVYITGVGGMTQLNGRYFKIIARTPGLISLGDLNGVPINATGYGAWTGGGTVARVYTLPSPYLASELALLKYAQNVNTMVFCHPNHVPYVLGFTNATSWAIIPITFGPSVSAPTNFNANSSLAAGAVNYAYRGTSVDVSGQESGPTPFATILNKQDLRVVLGSNSIQWTLATNAVSYNIYKTELSYGGVPPSGAQFGFIGNVSGTNIIDSNIAPDYSLTPPITYNPFSGSGLVSISITAGGTYTAVPVVIIAPPPSGITAAAQAVMQAVGVAISATGVNYTIGDTLTLPGGITLTVTAIGGFRAIAAFTVNYFGAAVLSVPTNPTGQLSTSGIGSGATFNITYTVASVILNEPGSGYVGAPAVSFSPVGATALATVGAASAGNPTVPTYFQQRLVLAGPLGNPQKFNMSQPASYYNFNYSNPTQPEDSIEGTLVSGQLNTIKSMISMPSGLVILTDKQAWLLNGGSAGSGITPINITAQAQAYNGSSDVRPIIANFDILYVQSKGSIVRDLTYNFYTNVYTGTDISILSSHLFYGYTITDWAFAEEPFKTVHAIRSDGTLLTLTFLKEQELIGWTHSDTFGIFTSIATVTEATPFGFVDATYVVCQRSIAGGQIQYVERFVERIFPNGVRDAWCVDSGLQYNGAPATNFSGGEHLGGATVTGLADGQVIAPFTMPTNGNFTLAVAASVVTVGLGFTCQLQTLALDLGQPTVQGQRKKITAVTVRVAEALGLAIGKTFDSLVAMKDLIIGNVGSATNEVVTGLVTADCRTVIDPSWDVPGQYCIEQSQPLPATILGVIPEIVVGDK